MKNRGILPSLRAMFRHLLGLPCPRNELQERIGSEETVGNQGAAPIFLQFGTGNRRAGTKTGSECRAEKTEVTGCRASSAAKRGISRNRQERKFATWGNASENRPKNPAFIHAELDKRGISA